MTKRTSVASVPYGAGMAGAAAVSLATTLVAVEYTACSLAVPFGVVAQPGNMQSHSKPRERQAMKMTATRSLRGDSVQKSDIRWKNLRINEKGSGFRQGGTPPTNTVALPSTPRRTPLKPGSRSMKCIRIGHIRGIRLIYLGGRRLNQGGNQR